MIDRVKQQLATVEKEYLKLHSEAISIDTWVSGVNSRRWPVGARWFYALQAVYVPSSQSKEINQ